MLNNPSMHRHEQIADIINAHIITCTPRGKGFSYMLTYNLWFNQRLWSYEDLAIKMNLLNVPSNYLD